ncbi:histone-arginine methyltransferase CARM1 [Crotalus adamanteus]|uniref:Histone-arginine methyltransferase CARM1 n=1 Tax=Crotalus adamanteus TaxID=8729 RepID=A0AAW1BZS9_CROAD
MWISALVHWTFSPPELTPVEGAYRSLSRPAWRCSKGAASGLSFSDAFLSRLRALPTAAVAAAAERAWDAKMAAAVVSVFPGVRLLTIGDANGEIQRHQEQQALRLEARTGSDAVCLALYSREWRNGAGLAGMLADMLAWAGGGLVA